MSGPYLPAELTQAFSVNRAAQDCVLMPGHCCHQWQVAEDPPKLLCLPNSAQMLPICILRQLSVSCMLKVTPKSSRPSRSLPWTNLLCKLHKIVNLDISSWSRAPQLSDEWLEQVPPLQTAHTEAEAQECLSLPKAIAPEPCRGSKALKGLIPKTSCTQGQHS